MLTHVEFADNRISQYELILRVTFFKDEMRDIHRHNLIADPTLLKADRKIDLGRIVSTDHDQLIEEEIEAEDHSLDRQSVQSRAEYFKEQLKIKWATGTVEQEVGLSTLVRNVA